MFIGMDLHLIILTYLRRGFSGIEFENLNFKFLARIFIFYSWLADSSSGTGTHVALGVSILSMGRCRLPYSEACLFKNAFKALRMVSR